MDTRWPKVTIKDVCESVIDCVNKTAPVVEYETPYKMIRTTNVKKGVVNLAGARFVEKATFDKWTRRAVPRVGDVILTREAPLGDVGMITTPNENIFLGQRLMQYRVDPEKLDAHYLLYVLQGPKLQGQLKAAGSGSTVEHIRVGDAENLEIELPPILDQREIGKVLANYDNLIENNNRRIAILEEMAQSLYREWFVNFRYPGHANQPDDSSDNKDSKPNLIDSPLGPIPEGWEVGKLESASSMKYGKMSKKELRCEEGIPIYSGYKITGYYPEANLNESKVIVVARGVGGTGDVKMSPDICWLTNLSIYIMENENILKKAYLFYQLKFSNLRSLDSGTSISQITIADLSKYKIIIPPIQIQQSFEAICCTFWSQIKVLSKQSENLKKQRDMLLPKLISGQIQLKD